MLYYVHHRTSNNIIQVIQRFVQCIILLCFYFFCFIIHNILIIYYIYIFQYIHIILISDIDHKNSTEKKMRENLVQYVFITIKNNFQSLENIIVILIVSKCIYYKKITSAQMCFSGWFFHTAPYITCSPCVCECVQDRNNKMNDCVCSVLLSTRIRHCSQHRMRAGGAESSNRYHKKCELEVRCCIFL